MWHGWWVNFSQTRISYMPLPSLCQIEEALVVPLKFKKSYMTPHPWTKKVHSSPLAKEIKIKHPPQGTRVPITCLYKKPRAFVEATIDICWLSCKDVGLHWCHYLCERIIGSYWLRMPTIFIDREAWGDNTFGSIHLSVRPSVCPSVCPWTLSRVNGLTYDLDFWHKDWPWPWLVWDCRSRS